VCPYYVKTTIVNDILIDTSKISNPRFSFKIHLYPSKITEKFLKSIKLLLYLFDLLGIMSEPHSSFKTIDVYVGGVFYDAKEKNFKCRTNFEYNTIEANVLDIKPTLSLKRALIEACRVMQRDDGALCIRPGMGITVWDPAMMKAKGGKQSSVKTKGYRPLHHNSLLPGSETIDVYNR
jgi:hypothetical protein